jgi:hypothetical protein
MQTTRRRNAVARFLRVRGKVIDLDKVAVFRLWKRHPGWDIVAIFPGGSVKLWMVHSRDGLGKAERILDALLDAWRSGGELVTEKEILAAAGVRVFDAEELE